MRTDRELLELAAKAAGLTSHRYCEAWKAMASCSEQGNNYSGPSWNPLTDDGDALRLAVKLSLHVRVCRRSVLVEMREFGDDIHIRLGVDPYSATRRAIVLAAAEIGKTRSE